MTERVLGMKPFPFQTEREMLDRGFDFPEIQTILELQRWYGLGAWDALCEEVRSYGCSECYTDWCKEELNLQGYGVAVLWNSIHPTEPYAKHFVECVEKHKFAAYNAGIQAGKDLLAANASGEWTIIPMFTGKYSELFFEGVKSVTEAGGVKQ